MRGPGRWSRTVTLLGGTARYDVYTPDDIEVLARDILVRKRRADLKARLDFVDGNWQVCPGPLQPQQPYSGKHFATMRDIERVRRAIEKTWFTLWTPDVADEVFPGWFLKKWKDLCTKIQTTTGDECTAYVQQRQQLLSLLTEWRQP